MIISPIYSLLGPQSYTSEETHSDILAYLLMPSSELGVSFLRHLLDPYLPPVDYTSAYVEREFAVAQRRGRVDILIRLTDLQGEECIVVIENKWGSSEHGDQLAFYHEHFANQQTVFIFLSPEGVAPSHAAYHAMSYTDVLVALDAAMQSQQDALPEAVNVLLRQYMELVKRSLSGKLTTIWQELADFLKDEIAQSDALDIDPKETFSNTWIGIMPVGWRENDALLAVKSAPAAWALTVHINIGSGVHIEFLWHVDDAHITPGAVYDCLQSHLSVAALHPPRSIGSGTKSWQTIYTFEVLSFAQLRQAAMVDNLSPQFKAHMQQQIVHFQQDVERLAEALVACESILTP